MNVQNKIIYIFNKFLINFLKAIKKDNYFKIAIKKNYKVIDKNSNKYIKTYTRKFEEFTELLCKDGLVLKDLLDNDKFKELNILKNINIGRLFKVFQSDEDSNTIMSYILTLQLLSMFYLESVRINEELMNFVNGTEKIIEDDDEKEEGGDDDGEGDDGDDDDEDGDDGDDSDDGDEDDDEDDKVDKEEELEKLLMKSLNIINNNDDNELKEILDDDIKNILVNIKKLKISLTTDEDGNGNIDDLIGDSKIGKLAKEISSQLDVDSLNLDINNPSELLNPANLFGGDNGNILGNLVQQVGSSITDKMNSGELKQEDLVKDAFSLMNKMQSNTSGNPILDNIMGNMMGNKEGGKGMDINSMMQNMMGGMNNTNTEESTKETDDEPNFNINDMMKNLNPDMMQQMMNSMGGSQAVNQNNPNSREGKAKEKLRKKLAEKNKNN